MLYFPPENIVAFRAEFCLCNTLYTSRWSDPGFVFFPVSLINLILSRKEANLTCGRKIRFFPRDSFVAFIALSWEKLAKLFPNIGFLCQIQ